MAERRITYCRSGSVVLSYRCAYACGYCDYPRRQSDPLPPKKKVMSSLREIGRQGAREVEITGGDGLASLAEILSTVRYYGFSDFLDYLGMVMGCCSHVASERFVFPLLNIGNLSLGEFRQLRPYLFAAKVLLESLDENLHHAVAHSHADCMLPKRRLATILDTGRARIPLTTGLIIGIGEKKASREKTLRVLAEVEERHGHIQCVCIQRFHPRPRTPMADCPGPSDEEVVETAAMARRLMPPSTVIQVPFQGNLHLIANLLEVGVRDLGSLPFCGGNGRNNRGAEQLRRLEAEVSALGWELTERLSVFPQYLTSPWIRGVFQSSIRSNGSFFRDLEPSIDTD